MINHSKTKTISITSGKGGVGKTSLTANIACALAKRGKKVLIFDGDGMVYVLLLEAATCDFEVIAMVVCNIRELRPVISSVSHHVVLSMS